MSSVTVSVNRLPWTPDSRTYVPQDALSHAVIESVLLTSGVSVYVPVSIGNTNKQTKRQTDRRQESNTVRSSLKIRDPRSFVIRFDFESYVRFEIRFVVMVRFEIFESSALSIVIRKETIGGG